MDSSGKPNMFSTDDRMEHSMKRKRLANIFSPQNVLAFEPRVRNCIQQFCAQWDMRCLKAAHGISGVNWTASNGRAVIDACPQFAYLALDIIGDLALGSPFGLIHAQRDSSVAIDSIDALGEPQIRMVEVPIIKINANEGMITMAVGVFPSWTHNFLRLLPWNISGILHSAKFFNLTKASVDARLKRGPRVASEDGKGSIDLVDRLLEVRNEDGTPLTTDELYAEALLLLAAGSDTTSNTLGSLCYHLTIYPKAQQKLQSELDQHVSYDPSDETDGEQGVVFPPCQAVTRYDMIKNLPYLNACVKEALRIHSTIGTGLPRVVPPGKTVTVARQIFKSGSVISIPSYTTHRSSVWGNDAGEFRPERWLEDSAGLLNKYFVPFSVGPRACIGRNLAYMNLMTITATIFRRYHMEALPTTKVPVTNIFIISGR
ncbi:hypothetical protein OPQ81_005188 [Rhizoctonia solani]|nr:hypothetical protein OPQ81_005188 [Rhizoctonia solani]